MMNKGFITLAVGNIRYYEMAHNLLLSYRKHSQNPLPFCIVADRENEITKDFDFVKIIDNPTKSYLDKLSILSIPQFENNIFIDADCLAYRDLNDLFDLMPKQGASCIGRCIPLTNETDGFFKINDVGEYKNLISFIPQMHGGLYFFKNDTLTKQIFEECLKIQSKYSNYKFKYFSAPADEPILALSIAANSGRLIEVDNLSSQQYFIFVPAVKRIICDISKGYLSYINYDNARIDNVYLCHWQNFNVTRHKYKNEILSLKNKNTIIIKIKKTLNVLTDIIKDSALLIKIRAKRLLCFNTGMFDC